ncbi:MAG: GNAT family N-acetyltransferase [Caldilineaceae bacterium]
MNLQARPYRDAADLTQMKQLLMAGAQANPAISYMHPGCVDWYTQNPPDAAANQRNLRLWERVDSEPPTLAAWAIHLRHEGSFDLFVSPAVHGAPAHAAVMDEYVAWAAARARESGLNTLWPFWAMTHDTVLTELMKERGFVVEEVDPPVPLFERRLDALPTIGLPAEFTVRGVSNLEDGRRRAAVTYAAFGCTDDWEAYAAEYAQFIDAAVYDGERDLIVIAPDGRGAAACTIWFDPVNGVGLFEPVATHPDFQGQGLGKAVMAEGLRRMQAAGMIRAIVGFDPNNKAALALYTSLGFGASAYFTVARKMV